ncbi:MAG: hypothetical protein ABW104_10490 [Candidatus Thiodiazotropha sp. 6PLUC2]
MNLKKKAWKYATAAVFVLIIFNPEMIELALFIDAIGLEVFLMLLEVQVLAILGALLNSKVRPVTSTLKHFLEKSFRVDSLKRIKEDAESLFFSLPSEAALMHLLVISAVIQCVFGMRS